MGLLIIIININYSEYRSTKIIGGKKENIISD